jgi:hypothetical protein
MESIPESELAVKLVTASCWTGPGRTKKVIREKFINLQLANVAADQLSVLIIQDNTVRVYACKKKIFTDGIMLSVLDMVKL